MYDFIKLRIDNFDTGLLGSYTHIDSTAPKYKKEDLGEAGTTEYHHKNIILTIFKSGYAEIKGSWHKYFNNGEHNSNDFAIEDFYNVTQHLSSLFKVDLFRCRLMSLEVGVNISPPIRTKEVLNNLLTHRKELFSRQLGNHKRYYEAKHQRYYVKIYDKAKQYQRQGQILRYELKYVRMYDHKENGIVYLNDLLKPKSIAYLKTLLSNEFRHVLIFDPTIRQNELTDYQRAKLKEWANDKYWKGLTKKQHYAQKRFYSRIVKNHSDNIHGKLQILIAEKLEELTPKRVLSNHPPKNQKRVLSNPLYKGLISDLAASKKHPQNIEEKEPPPPPKSTIETLEAKRVCKTCGVDISHRSKRAKFCEQKKCRNKDSNPRNNIRRSFERIKNKPTLFDLTPYKKEIENKYNITL